MINFIIWYSEKYVNSNFNNLLKTGAGKHVPESANMFPRAQTCSKINIGNTIPPECISVKPIKNRTTPLRRARFP
ncbi:hypothetical protein GCM10007063_27940 [Lentibacillus kapialis]|uniref:Uncharacterized protein n=1 Tax=Lentibacillus kapialis TaxID=340214 RepID=A0A917Q0Q4_9BACI|nr:hypothetical protein GCM10007063_27940 [Lentibacillus kapialis]